jgi:hypothetical protein
LIANRSVVKIVDSRAESVAKAAQGWLIRSRHCSQHIGRGRRKRVNKDETVVPPLYGAIGRRLTRRLGNAGPRDCLAGRRQIVLIEKMPEPRL